MKLNKLHVILAGSALLLSVASLVVVLANAVDEPYLFYRRRDLIVQVGGAMILMMLWLQVAGVVVYGIVCRRISMLWLALLLWAFICECYLYAGSSGYIHDLAEIVRRQ